MQVNSNMAFVNNANKIGVKESLQVHQKSDQSLEQVPQSHSMLKLSTEATLAFTADTTVKSSMKKPGAESNRKNLSVRFPEKVVSEVRLRPKTKLKNKHKLFYTPQEYFMFRREFRAFKQQQNREEDKSSSPLLLALSFASRFISGVEIRHRNLTSTDGITVDDNKPFASSSDVVDSLYLY